MKCFLSKWGTELGCSGTLQGGFCWAPHALLPPDSVEWNPETCPPWVSGTFMGYPRSGPIGWVLTSLNPNSPLSQRDSNSPLRVLGTAPNPDASTTRSGAHAGKEKMGPFETHLPLRTSTPECRRSTLRTGHRGPGGTGQGDTSRSARTGQVPRAAAAGVTAPLLSRTRSMRS